ncbi:hypothetical protein BDP81DRAFT_420901 [Colletotrichum phormii]|uniref:Uncharacterized protein n=1 Tax=Colletotrichum phormii TaxID=359342 RepID=A0AAJ0EJV0_9PEZI|nr:uncharacterized protein BDP81DRAFT_420901 [Colletotrichum phormii]KAK1639401.1 hypothetical protein BDP81DRAFT_420901 [Colletotrichum phormii]
MPKTVTGKGAPQRCFPFEPTATKYVYRTCPSLQSKHRRHFFRTHSRCNRVHPATTAFTPDNATTNPLRNVHAVTTLANLGSGQMPPPKKEFRFRVALGHAPTFLWPPDTLLHGLIDESKVAGTHARDSRQQCRSIPRPLDRRYWHCLEKDPEKRTTSRFRPLSCPPLSEHCRST